jgi:hypothetical protein
LIEFLRQQYAHQLLCSNTVWGIPLNERREHHRKRALLAGRISLIDGHTASCAIKNFSPAGAKIEFVAGTPVPSELHFTWDREPRDLDARIIWKTSTSAGLCFFVPPPKVDGKK